MRLIALAAVALTLSSCGEGSAPETNAEPDLEAAAAIAADRLQAMGEAFSVVEVAARAQTAFDVAPDKARLMISARDPNGTLVLDEAFALRPDRDIDSPRLDTETKPGYQIHTFSLSDDDAPRILSVRERLADLKAAAPGENELSLNAYVEGCLKDGHEAPGALHLTFFLRIRPNEDFFPLFSETAVPNTGQNFQSAFWTPCSERRGT